MHITKCEIGTQYTLFSIWSGSSVQVRIIFEEPIFYEISGARGFEIAVYDLCNWGKALTRFGLITIRQHLMIFHS